MRPILDTHIHFYEVTRPAYDSRVGWPAPGSPLHRDVLPAEYEARARPLGIVGSGVVEASPLHSDTGWVLDLVAGNSFFPFYVAQLEIGSADFVEQLAQVAGDNRVVGIRGFLHGPTLDLGNPKQRSDLEDLAKRGMTLDLISRRNLNPKSAVDALARALPTLRIIIDHLGGALGEKVDPLWERDMRRVAQNANVHVKFSSFFDVFNPSPTGDESRRWSAPRTLAPYQAHFDFLMAAFGPDRLVWGSNWPVCELGGTLEDEIAIAEEYLGRLGEDVRHKVMAQNATKFYRRVAPSHGASGLG